MPLDSGQALRSLWADPQQRQDLLAFMARDLSKVGSLSGYAEHLRSLSSLLSPEESLQLYTTLRDDSGRLEFEWRAEFLSFFPQAAPLLPPEEMSESDVRAALALGAFRPVRPSSSRGRKA